MSKKNKLIETLLRWREDPVCFVREAFGVEPDEWQKEALKTLVVEDRLAIRSGHGVGKTAFLAWVILWWMLTRKPCKVACTANSVSQLKDALWAEIRLWHAELPEFFKAQIEVQADRVVFVEDKDKEEPPNFAVARTARREKPEALAGFHSKYMLFVIDEASGVEDIIFETASGAMSSAGAKIIMTGNPTRSSGYFYNAFHKNADLWHKMKVSGEDSPRVTEKYKIELIREHGEDSNVFRYRYLGEFPIADEDAVVPRHLVEAAVNRDVQQTGQIVWGVDVARYGNDRSTLCKRHGNVIPEPIKFWRNLDGPQLGAKIVAEYSSTPEKERPEKILIDVIGVGAAAYDYLKRAEVLEGCSIQGINVSERPSNQELYMRLRDELWFKIKEFFEARDCRIPDQEMFIEEICAPRYDLTNTSKLKVESKDEIKKRGQKSPDLAEAFLMTLASETRSKRFWMPVSYPNGHVSNNLV